MTDIDVEKKRDRTKKRLYSLFQEQINKLERLAHHSGISPAEYLRELIDVEYIRKFSVTRYGGGD